MEGFIGQIVLFAGNFAPQNWAICNGQLLQTQQHSALFAVVGTNYGGDGQSTFALPDLRTAVPVGSGNPAGGLPSTRPGERGVINQSSGSEPQVGTVGLNYIICLQGVFPPRL